jgi:protein-disulfide isomerase
VTESKLLRPTARGLALVISLGVAHALWALFQWTQLVAARTGGTPFCGLGDLDPASCAHVWDSAFASTVQEWTGVPVAGWGLIWSLAAVALPLWALVERASPEPPADSAKKPGAAWAATIWLAIGGAAAIIVLLIASMMTGALCTTCVLTYTLVASYVAACFVQTPPQTVPLSRGVSLAAGSLAVAFVLLFIPGLQTPMNESAEARKALLKATAEAPVEESSSQQSSEQSPHPPLDDTPGHLVARLLQQLPPQLLQAFADELHRYREAPTVELRAARALMGPTTAAVRMTEFTDVLCSHCANLHETISQLQTAVPADALAVEPRHFPLDAGCNPTIEGEPVAPVRCLAARATICFEGRPTAFEFAGSLYEHQQDLSEEQVYALAEPHISRVELRACVNDPATEAKLQDDIAWATEHDIDGTPLVLINGKRVAAFGPLLYALILTGGEADHPVYANLPKPQVGDPHAGHQH